MNTDELRAQELALQAQLTELRAKREEAEREEKERALADTPITVRARALFGALIMTDSDFRPDVIEVLRNTPGRLYKGNRENQIPLKEWHNFVERVTALSQVKIAYNLGVEAQIDYQLNAPIWLIKKEKAHFAAIPGPGGYANIVHGIPGTRLDTQRKPATYLVPLTEGWRLMEKLSEIEGVVIEDDALTFIEQQITDRAKIDTIALQEDSPEVRAKLRRYIIANDGNIGDSLRNFQAVGINFIDLTGGRGLIADEMGLGKTWQAVGYALMKEYRKILVICPASLKSNWAREIRQLSGERAYALSGRNPSKYDMVSMVASDGPRWLIMNYDILGSKVEYKDESEDTEGYLHVEQKKQFPWAEVIKAAKPDLIIMDESHYIKNVDSNRSQAARTLANASGDFIALTGTPVLNRPGEFWPTLHLISPEIFPQFETFKNQYTWNGKEARNVAELRSILKTMMIRRMKKDVVKDLPPINRINEYHELTPRAKKLYDKVLQGVWNSLAEYDSQGIGGGEMSVTSILAQIMRLKQVCAVDKVDHTAELAQEFVDSAEADEGTNGKALIFTQFKGTAVAIAQRLGHECLSFVTRGETDFVTAETGERDRLVQQFQTDPRIKYLVVTEKTAKEGHNITEAGAVFFNDLFWTPAAHEQGEGRAYGRLSNLHSINSYYMITDMDGDSIEEWIWELLAKKMKVIAEVVDGVEESRDDSIVGELIEKMRNSLWTRGK